MGGLIVTTLTAKSGTGLFTVKVTTTDGMPPIFNTVTRKAPATAMELAGISACNCVVPIKWEETIVELKVTVEFTVNPVPAMVSVNEGPPAVALAGVNKPTTGWTFTGRIVIVEEEEVTPLPPFPTGSVTEMSIIPCLAMSCAEMLMASCVLLRNVVSRCAPLKFTVVPFKKFKPFTINVKAGPPATTIDGLKEEIAGGGP